jgi:hypothetical protein
MNDMWQAVYQHVPGPVEEFLDHFVLSKMGIIFQRNLDKQCSSIIRERHKVYNITCTFSLSRQKLAYCVDDQRMSLHNDFYEKTSLGSGHC